jgi:nitroimidazol reductase NimA-like FMN-containing flavoprotein (pyridoxamine 5'-phosphate oxidase superfamily)
MSDLDGHRGIVQRAIVRSSFCTLATSSTRNRPHVVGVLYVAVDRSLYVASFEGSKKVRNILENPRIGVCIPVRKYPIGPPFCVQFEGTAEILSPQDRDIVALLQTRRLKRITALGELAEPRLCFIRVTPDRTVSTYGLGVPLLTLLRDPHHASRSVEPW